MLDEIKKEIDNGEVDFKVINFEIDEDILLERIVNRVSCPACGEIYNNKFTPPKKAGLCDKCGKNLNDGPCDCRDEGDPRLAVLRQLLENED